MDQILKTISETAERIFSELPKPARSKILLTGGSAAYFYGSNRPFSNDVDFMIAKKEIPETEKIFNVKFEYFTKKPIFHSLKAIVNQSVTIDLIAESIIQPDNQDVEFKIELSGIVSKRKKEFLINGHSIFCVPKELLVLIKLLAGRGKKLNKYDLEDIYQIISKNEDFDFDYLKKLIL
ncbi:hypothetical protein KKF04_01705, partial [Patescibacteria group bacterium]|nr:hypothetical protein [Patescibacteria group bacterium]